MFKSSNTSKTNRTESASKSSTLQPPLIDTHTHTNFSPDSQNDPENFVRYAIAKGLKYLSITDHQENEFYPSKWCVDFDKYIDTILNLKAKYKNEIELALGIEIGYAPNVCSLAKSQVDTYPFDTVITSVHNINGVDLYYPTFYENKTKFQAYEKYLSVVEESVNVDYYFSQVGHLGYITRYAPYENKHLDYNTHAEKLDRILKKIIEKQAILEVNTSFNGGISMTSEEMLVRFFELGGRLTTFASDTHANDRLCDKYYECLRMLKRIGYKEIFYCIDRKHYGIKI